MYQGAKMVRIDLGQQQLSGEKLAIGGDDVEIRCIADTVAGEGNLPCASQRVNLAGLLAFELPVFLVGDQRIGHVLEGDLYCLLIQIERLALACIGELYLVEIGLHTQERLDEAYPRTPFCRGGAE